MRNDGRAPRQMRQVKFTPGYLLTAEGSVLIEMGNTRVLCAATVDDSVPHWLRGGGRGWVTAEYSMLPRSTATRTPREISKGRASGRTMEIQRLIGRSLRTVVDMQALGERTVIVDCDVLQADGGTRTASITGAYVAMALAVEQLRQYGTLAKNPIKDQVAAVSVGVVGGAAALDLNYDEDSNAAVDMNVVMTGSGEFVEVQATGEKSTFTQGQLVEMLALASEGIRDLIAAQQGAVARG
jgi:ribonuclease PH